MSKVICLILVVVICLTLCSCAPKYVVSEENMVNPAKFYYSVSNREDTAAFSEDTGFLRWELRDLRLQFPSPEHILIQYLSGPKSEELSSPFPRGLGVEYTTLEQGLLTIGFNDVFYELQGPALTMAAACIVHTMTQFDGIEFVCLQAPQTMVSGLMSVPLEPADFVFHDDYTTSDQTEIHLYFPNRSGRYLREETRRETITDDNGLPAFILRQLLEGPQSTTALPAFPTGTELLDVQVTEGLCSINLNEAFSKHAPQDVLSARLQLMAIVNSLTELTTVRFVRFLSNGQTLTRYGPLNIPSFFEREEASIEPDEPSLVYDVTFWLPYAGTDKLVSVPCSVRKSGSKTAEQSVVSALLEWESRNGCTNPFPDENAILEVRVVQRICRVTLGPALSEYASGDEEQMLAVRSLVATLSAMDSVTRVEIILPDDDASTIRVSRIVLPEDDWYLK